MSSGEFDVYTMVLENKTMDPRVIQTLRDYKYRNTENNNNSNTNNNNLNKSINNTINNSINDMVTNNSNSTTSTTPNTSTTTDFWVTENINVIKYSDIKDVTPVSIVTKAKKYPKQFSVCFGVKKSEKQN